MVPIGSRVTVDDISSAFVEKDDVEKRKRRRKSGVVYNSFMIIGKCFQYTNIFYTLVKSTILKSMLLGETNIPIFV
jgi:ABC-type phosphate/phosphonate transport system ATPase subunit|tara:strand:- start:276 stop:503 length:228 start_codon:yes stop_codon:yes gene_type:complete